MSVKGFQVGQTVEKYDYTELVNKPTIPTKTSDLTNDSGFLTSAPVSSVNGNTGAVTVPTLPSGGTFGQFLVKQSSTDYDAAWVTLATWQGGSY